MVEAAGAKRREVYYRGHVQGVGFRFRVARLASNYPVTGFVRNLDDGRVELVAEGQESALTSFLDAVAHSLGEHIREIQQGIGPATGEFSSFDIRA